MSETAKRKIFSETINAIVNSKLFFWLVVCLFPLLTFNFYSPDYDTGLDTSYAWAYNYLFLNKFSSLQKIVYPYGLFGFVKMPFPYLSLYVIHYFFVVFFKSLFCYLILRAVKSKSALYIILNVLILFFCCDYLYLDYLLLGNLLLLLIRQYFTNNRYFFIVASLLMTCAMLLKVNIMINSLAIYIFAFLITVVYSPGKKQQVLNYTYGLALFFISGILFYGGIQDFFTFLKGSFIISGGYNEALCTESEINFLYFIPLAIILAIIAHSSFVRRRYIELIFGAFLFFAWKHTVVRLDSGHFYNLIMSMVIFAAVWIAAESKLAILKFILCTGCIICFYIFGKDLSVFPDGIQLRNGLKEFIYTSCNLTSIIERCDSITTANYNKSRLPDDVRAMIGNSKTDAYPFELSYFKDTSINYTPRYTLQSGSNSSWLDNYSKLSIEEQQIKFYIFHKTDGGKIKLMNIDRKYLLNEEPVTILHLLSAYKTVYINGSFAVIEKTAIPSLTKEKAEPCIDGAFNRWIRVPGDSEHVFRLKVEFEKPIAYKLRSFLYKPTIFYITYKFADDSLSERLRFVPANAKDGLWINPFYFDFKTTKRVKEIFLESADKSFNGKTIGLKLDSYKINRAAISSPDSLFSVKKHTP